MKTPKITSFSIFSVFNFSFQLNLKSGRDWDRTIIHNDNLKRTRTKFFDPSPLFDKNHRTNFEPESKNEKNWVIELTLKNWFLASSFMKTSSFLNLKKKKPSISWSFDSENFQKSRIWGFFISEILKAQNWRLLTKSENHTTLLPTNLISLAIQSPQ